MRSRSRTSRRSSLDEVPGHLIVIGGGYVGLELSRAMRRFGGNVTVIDRNDRLVHQEDDDVTEALHGLFRDEGIDMVLNARIRRVSGKSGQRVRVVFERDGVEKTLEGTHLLVASGRLPNTEGIGLELADVELTNAGYVKVNERLETTAPGVWAVGDVTGGPKFTHISFDDFLVIRDNINGGNHVTNRPAGSLLPVYGLRSWPVWASARSRPARRACAYRLFKIPMAAVLRARTLSETRGIHEKLLVEMDGEGILGFTAFGVDAGEIMSAVQMAMIAGLPYPKVRDAILTHPTLMEGLVPLFSSAPATVARTANAGA